MAQKGMPFEGTDNKAVVRQQWDLPILKRRKDSLGQPLHYFGLPGAYIEDLLDWRDLLGFRTGVERLRSGEHELQDRDIHRQIYANVIKSKISAQFELLLGDVEDIIVNGLDKIGNQPCKSSGSSPLTARFHYNVVNPDFCGGMGNPIEREGLRRVEMLKKLLERQRGNSLTLLLTLNVRDKIGDTIIEYLEDAKRRSTSSRMREMLEWYQTTGRGHKEFRLKAVVPLFVKRFAEHYGFDCYCYPALVYTGTGEARMVHFAFDLTTTKALLHSTSRQSQEDVLDLILFEVHDKVLRVHDVQHRHCDLSRCAAQLDFLPQDTVTAILSALPAASP